MLKFTAASFQRVAMTVGVFGVVGLANFITAKPSQAVTLGIPVENFTYTNGAVTSSTTPFDVFEGSYGFINAGGKALSGSSPNITASTIGRLKSLKVSFDYALNNVGSDTLNLFLSKGDTKQLLTQLPGLATVGKVNLDITDTFKNVFTQEGVGSFNFLYELSSGNTASVAGFDNVALTVEVPEPATTVIGFAALTIAVGTMQRKRKSVGVVGTNKA